MGDEVNICNLWQDRKIYGRWSELTSDYFSNEKSLNALYDIFLSAKTDLPERLDIVELGSAEGLLGEYFANRLSSDRKVSLTLVDSVMEHLVKNKNQNTKKVCADLLTFQCPDSFDLCIMRSVLHYFSKESQKTVLRNAHVSTKPGGHLLLQAWVPYQESLDLFIMLNRYVGKQFVPVTTGEVEKTCAEAGFGVRALAAAPTWYCGSQSFRIRYGLTDSQITEMASIIQGTPLEKRTGFTCDEKDFTIPVPYQVYLLKKD